MRERLRRRRDREGRREEKKGNFLKMSAKSANQGDRMERSGRQHHPKHHTRPLPPARAVPTYEHLHLLATGASESEPAPRSSDGPPAAARLSYTDGALGRASPADPLQPPAPGDESEK